MAARRFDLEAIEKAQDDRCFFDRDGVHEVIERLADGPITVVVGAGSSAEAGFPPWHTLVQRLLAGAVHPTRDDNLIDRLIEREGLLGAASIALTELGKPRFARALVSALTADMGAPVVLPRPGPTAQAVAKVFGLWDTDDSRDHCHLFTTNYDLLLEEALTAAGTASGRPAAVPHMGKGEPGGSRPGTPVVRHLHGYIDDLGLPTARGTGLVISEADYFINHPNPWQTDILEARVEDSAMLFVGASMTDLDLVRMLYQTRDRARSEPVLLITRDQATGEDEDVWTGHRAAALQHELLAKKKWQAIGAHPLYTDWYMQNAQFLYELCECRRARAAGQAYRGYSERLEDWHDRFRDQILKLTSLEDFRKSQEATSAELATWVRSVETILNMTKAQRHDEGLAIHVWTRIPSERQLANSLRSDQVWLNPWATDRRRITQPARPSAITTFCHGYEQRRANGVGALWQSSLAIPVRIETPELGDLPVGVVVLMSKLPLAESALGLAAPGELDLVRALLADVSRTLLTPA